MQELIEKITKAKRAGVVAQVIECLPRKQGALNSNPHTAKEKKRVFEEVGPHPGPSTSFDARKVPTLIAIL
jgi:hypothetical protein